MDQDELKHLKRREQEALADCDSLIAQHIRLCEERSKIGSQHVESLLNTSQDKKTSVAIRCLRVCLPRLKAETTEHDRQMIPKDPMMCQNKKALYLASLGYARATNLLLAARLCTKLPLELRDRIYLYLWDDSSSNALIKAKSLIRPGCNGPPCTCLHALPHFIDLNYMGPYVAAEILDVFRYTCGLTWKTGIRWTHHQGYVALGDLKEYLEDDVFHVGLSREEVFAKRYLEVGLYDYPELRTLTTGKRYEKLRSYLQELQNLPMREGRQVTFSLYSSREESISFTNHCRILKKPFWDLLERGHKVEVYVEMDASIGMHFSPSSADWERESWKKDVWWSSRNTYFKLTYRIVMGVLYGVEGSEWREVLKMRKEAGHVKEMEEEIDG